MRPASVQLFGTFVLALLAGCGEPAGPRRVAVSGMVTHDGQSVPSGAISMLPNEGRKGVPANGAITNGSYSIPADQGPMPGVYRVVINHQPPKDQLLEMQKAGTVPKTSWEFEVTVPDAATFERDFKLTGE